MQLFSLRYKKSKADQRYTKEKTEKTFPKDHTYDLT